MSDTHITPEHRRAFKALTSGECENFALFSCTVNGAPASAIVAVCADGGERHIHPLFVSVTPDMHLADHDGQAPRGR